MQIHDVGKRVKLVDEKSYWGRRSYPVEKYRKGFRDMQPLVDSGE